MTPQGPKGKGPLDLTAPAVIPRRVVLSVADTDAIEIRAKKIAEALPGLRWNLSMLDVQTAEDFQRAAQSRQCAHIGQLDVLAVYYRVRGPARKREAIDTGALEIDIGHRRVIDLYDAIHVVVSPGDRERANVIPIIFERAARLLGAVDPVLSPGMAEDPFADRAPAPPRSSGVFMTLSPENPERFNWTFSVCWLLPETRG